MFYWSSHMWPNWYLFPSGIIVVVFWALIIWLIIRLINKSKSEVKEEKSPLEIVDERYAKGELTKKEFDQMKKDLKKD